MFLVLHGHHSAVVSKRRTRSRWLIWVQLHLPSSHSTMTHLSDFPKSRGGTCWSSFEEVLYLSSIHPSFPFEDFLLHSSFSQCLGEFFNIQDRDLHERQLAVLDLNTMVPSELHFGMRGFKSLNPKNIPLTGTPYLLSFLICLNSRQTILSRLNAKRLK